MLGIPSFVAASASSALFVPAFVLCAEALGSMLPARNRGKTGGEPERAFRVAVLVPAHDEELGIAKTVRALRAELGPADRLLVVADNCSDRTAEFAREAGAEVAERSDPERRGKGHALSFGARVLAEDPPDVVVVMDADCRVERGTLRRLAEAALRSNRPAQAVYLMHAPERRGVSAVSAFAFLVRNLVRPSGLERFGLPVQLTGTGMAFPWATFRDAPATGGFLVEDLLMGHELALSGHPPMLCDDVLVGSDLPQGAEASLKQRRRWEHGELAVLLGTAPRLVAQGLLRRDPGLIALGLDAAVPPLALLVMLEGAAVGTGVAIAVLGGSSVPLLIALTSCSAITLGLGAAWLAHGRRVLTLKDVAEIPGYIAWKFPLYGSFFRRGPHSEWERTERK